MDSRLKHIRPEKAERFLIKNGFEHINTKGTHHTFFKKEIGFVQIIFNSKELYPKNAKIMIKKSGISIEEWAKSCK